MYGMFVDLIRASTEDEKVCRSAMTRSILGSTHQGPPPPLPSRSPALAIWDVSRNALAGTLPNEPPPPNLRILGVSGNAGVGGAIPAEMFPVTSGLRHVDLSGNSLNGTLPESLMGLVHARLVNVSNNEIAGTIPSEGFVDLRRMKAIREFDASHNRLSGSIPPALAGLTTLRVLDLSRNDLNGTLPSHQMAGLVHLRKLDLRRNTLSGTLSPELANLRQGLHWSGLDWIVGRPVHPLFFLKPVPPHRPTTLR